MLTFKEFRNKQKKDFDSSMYVHGKHAQKKDFDSSMYVHGKHAQEKKLKEEVEEKDIEKSTIKKWVSNKSGNKNLGKTPDEQMQKLEDDHPLHDDHKPAIVKYTQSSGSLNRHLLESHEDGVEPNKHYNGYDLNGIEKSFHPSKHDFDSFTGVGADPRKFHTIKTEDGADIKHMPAHFSSSLKRETAHDFSWAIPRDREGHNDYHVIHWHIKKGDPISVIGSHSHFKSELSPYAEHEVLMPRTCKELGNYYMKHHKTDIHTDKDGHKLFVHHCSLSKQ